MAKKRIWSTIGGISSERVNPIGLPVFSTSRAISSSARDSIASAMRNTASERSDGVVSRQRLERRGGGLHRRVDVGRSRERRFAVLLAGRRVDHRRRPTVGGVDVLAVDEVREGLHGASCTTPTPPVRYRRSNYAWRRDHRHPLRRRAEGDQDRRTPGGDDARRRPRARAPRDPGLRRGRCGRGRLDHRRRLPGGRGRHRGRRPRTPGRRRWWSRSRSRRRRSSGSSATT